MPTCPYQRINKKYYTPVSFFSQCKFFDSWIETNYLTCPSFEKYGTFSVKMIVSIEVADDPL